MKSIKLLLVLIISSVALCADAIRSSSAENGKPKAVSPDKSFMSELEALKVATQGVESQMDFYSSIRRLKNVTLTREDFTPPRDYSSEQKVRSASMANGVKFISDAIKQNDVVIIPQNDLASMAVMFYKGKNGSVVGFKLTGGKWVESPGLSVSNCLSKWPVIIGVMMGDSVGVKDENNKSNKPAWGLWAYKVKVN